MKTLADPRCTVELLERLKAVRPDSVRRWGRMSPHQMICHVSDAYRMATGERLASDATGTLQRTVIKWVALYTPMRWPTGIQTRPEADQHRGGTSPVDFAADVAMLATLLESIVARRSQLWPTHPIFGPMTEKEWLRWGYLHMDHHLRQFGA